MKRPVSIPIGALMLLGAWTLHAQRSLTVRDYDAFYKDVILKASNESRDKWLASYDPVVTFVTRVRQDVEKQPEATRQVLAKAVHDNGYWKSQQARIGNAGDPFVGSRFKAGDQLLKAVLTPKGYQSYRDRYSQGSRGYRLSLEAVADRAAFYRLQGKVIPRLSEIPADTVIVNANAQSWDDLVADAGRYPDPVERMEVIVRNQVNAIASALALLRGSQTRSDAEMDYATAVIWWYTGHHSGKDGWEKEPLIRVPYSQLPEAEKAKDRPVWQAVREVLKAHPL
jgi:hypothetical protein